MTNQPDFSPISAGATIPHSVYRPFDRRDDDADLLSEQLRDFSRSVLKHKWSIFGLAVAVSLLASLFASTIQPIYRSTATLMMEPSKRKLVGIEEIYGSMSDSTEFYRTQAEILRSGELARRIVEKGKLTEHPALDPRQHKDTGFSLAKLLPEAWMGEHVAPEIPRTAVQSAVVARFKGELSVELVSNTQLIKVSYDSPDREFAAYAANLAANGFIEADLDARLAMTQKAGAWLTEQLTELRKKLEISERALQQFRERERIVYAKGVAQSGASTQLEQLAGGLVSARQKRAEAEAAYTQVQTAQKAGVDIESIPTVLRNPQFAQMKSVESVAESKFADSAKRYGPDHPKRQSAEADYKTARDNTKRQLETIVTSITKEYELARAQETAVAGALAQSKGDILELNRKEYELGVLEREVASNKSLYEVFTTRMKETNVAGDVQSPIARVVDPAIVSGGPIKPDRTRLVGVACLVALMFGVALALLVEYLDNTIKGADDVIKRLRQPLLGQLPKLKGKLESGDIQIAFTQSKDTEFSEAIRSIRTGVLLSSFDAPHKVLLVTSSLNGEGKTSLATNIALALGQVRKVCLVDADMRRPSVANVLGVDTLSKGLSNLVSGSDPISECIHFDETLGIHIVPSGIVPPNPLELLSSIRFANAVASLESEFDIVVIDSPPLQMVSDPLVLSQFANSVIYVVMADATPYRAVLEGLDRLQNAGAHVLGIVINQVDAGKAERYYGYGNYANSGAGYSSKLT